ncbi:MAG TPA: alpha/beta hydrolase [Casimicrobiaceae bacterium]
MRIDRSTQGAVTTGEAFTNPLAAGSGDAIDAPVLIVPGLRDSAPAHWQTHWQKQIQGSRRVVQCDALTPDLKAWTVAIQAQIDACPTAPIIIAHGFGCLAAVSAADHGSTIRAALLVAPADPERFGFDASLGGRALPFPTTLVASSDDPSLKLVRAAALASAWGSVFVPYRNAGHINAESGFGPWPQGFAHLQELMRRMPSRLSAAPTRLSS